jgi:hypothetical protein
MDRLNPAITKYHYHYAAIYYSEDVASLKDSAKSIDLTVGKDDPNHPDLPLLRVAYSEKLGELRGKQPRKRRKRLKKKLKR